VKVFPDTNVVASAFATRGLCTDVLRLILAENEMVTGEVLIGELRAVLRSKFVVPAGTVGEIENFMRGYHVEPEPGQVPNVKLRDRNDLLVLGSALAAKAEILITADKEILNLNKKPKTIQILNPREFWDLASSRGKRKS
jgi:putative PIN family toxin of toxin-antitoxin system